MINGLFDLSLIAFIFTPLAMTVILFMGVIWRQCRKGRATDGPELLLAAAARWMAEERKSWGEAMATELKQVRGQWTRWRFALGCARVALFPPRRADLGTSAGNDRSPVFGALAVALPPLGLPLIYFTAAIMEAIGGSPFTAASRWSDPEAVMAVAGVVVKLLFLCVLAGLPLGMIGLYRRERLRSLSALGMLSSVCITCYFLVIMSLIAMGPNGD